MKKATLLFGFIFFSLFSCNDNCVSSEIAGCNDSVPNQDVTCLAYFESWFYDASDQTCSKIGYSGCEESGFQSKEECEACQCN